MTLRLMLVADDPLSASALRRALRATSLFEVMDGYVEGRADCSAIASVCRPDVAVIDEMSSSGNTIARISEIRGEAPAAKIIVLATHMETARLNEAASAGADAAVAKTFRLDGIVALVREVAAGNVFHTFDARHAHARRTPRSGQPALTDRELEILRLVAAGAPNGRIAARLWITEQTVKFHLSNVYRKLGVSNRTEASHHAHVYGLLETTSSTGVAA